MTEQRLAEIKGLYQAVKDAGSVGMWSVHYFQDVGELLKEREDLLAQLSNVPDWMRSKEHGIARSQITDR